jgi:class 3 adenylate cyclase/regulator of replication initiation timing
MRRRVTTSGKASKARRGKALNPKGRIGSAAPRDGGSSAADLKEQFDRLRDELAEARKRLAETLEQQTATTEVLKVINSSAGKLEPVFNVMLQNAVHICDASFGNLLLYDGNVFRHVALHNAPSAWAAERDRDPVPPRDLARVLYSVAETKRVVHVADIAVENPDEPIGTIAGARTLLLAPMIKEHTLVGVIAIYRQHVRLFTDKQIDLLTSFAAQAVIAIENTRLLNELRHRTDDLTEALEHQTATAEVLKVISGSPGELKPVFQTILDNATRICEAHLGTLLLCEGDLFRIAALHGPPDFADWWARNPVVRPGPETAPARAALTRQPVRIADLAAESAYASRDPLRVNIVERAGARTLVAVPMLKDNELIGTITIYRQEARPFTDKNVELVQNFAAQAVIAIENARLLKELRERTEQISELNQQLGRRVADQVGEIERMGRLRRFLPPQVADLIVASGDEKQLESHRREITALFCDLRGFTGFAESSDPEDVIALLHDYHAAIGNLVVKYNGTLERYAGDGVMVVFNDPMPIENPTLQAVLMALDMRGAIGTLIERWRRLGHDIGFGIGIAHGFATLGTIGFEGRFDYAAIGTVSNVASRLCDEAQPGQILVSPRVLMAVENSVTVETAGEFTLKGISRPITAYNVLRTIQPTP